MFAATNDLVPDAEFGRVVVDLDCLAAGDARDAEAPGHDGRMACGSSSRGEDAFRMKDSMHVVRGGLEPHEDDRLCLVPADPLGLVGIEGHDAHRGTGGRIEAFREEQARTPRLGLGRFVELREEQLNHMIRLDPEECFLLRNKALPNHIEGDPDGGPGGRLGGPGLEDPQLPPLDGELDVLGLSEMVLEALSDAREVGVDLRITAPKLGDFRWRSDSRDDVLALGVREVLPVQLFRARHLVPGERNPRARVGPHVAEHHHLDVRGGPERMRDLVEGPVVNRPLSVPRSEDGRDGFPQLLFHVRRKFLADLVAVQVLEIRHDRFQLARPQVGVLARRGFLFVAVQGGFELSTVDLLHNPPVHRHEPPIRIPSEPFVRHLGESLDGRVVQSDVQDRVHHPGHRDFRTRPNGNQQRVRGVPKPTTPL